MKVAHVNYLPTYLSGVKNKIIAQANAAYIENINIDFFILNSKIELTENNIYYKKIQFNEKEIFKAIQQKLFRYKIIEALIPFKEYDCIILRYPLAMGFGMKSFYRKWGKMIVTEHHTIEENELKFYFKNRLLSLACSLIEKKNKHYISQYTLGMIGVTNEIVMSNPKPYRKKMITNGFDITSVNISSRPQYNKVFNMIFIASRFAIWHGLDRVIDSAQKYSGPKKINIKLVGKILNRNTLAKLKSFKNQWINFELMGTKNNDQLDNIYLDTHLGISSMGLYNIGLQEACVLKTREYIARGIPFIYGYQDSDLSGKEVFAYQATQDDNLINFNEVIDFYIDLVKNDDYQSKMKKFALDNIDMRVKIKEMWDFTNGISILN